MQDTVPCCGCARTIQARGQMPLHKLIGTRWAPGARSTCSLYISKLLIHSVQKRQGVAVVRKRLDHKHACLQRHPSTAFQQGVMHFVHLFRLSWKASFTHASCIGIKRQLFMQRLGVSFAVQQGTNLRLLLHSGAVQARVMGERT